MRAPSLPESMPGLALDCQRLTRCCSPLPCRSVRGAYPFLPGAAVFSYDPPAGAGPIDVAARAAQFARQYIEEDVRGEQRQAAVAWEKAAWVEEALAWLRDEGVQLPDDMEEKVAAAAAAAAAEAAAEDGQGAGAAGGKEVSEAERRRHLPELKRAAQKAAAGGPGAQASWRELAVRLAALARVSRRRLLRHEADPAADALHGGTAMQHASSMPLAQAAAAAAQGQLVRRAGTGAAAATPADEALQDEQEGEQDWGSDQGSQAAAAALQQQLTEALAGGALQPGEEEEEGAPAAGAGPEAPPEGSLAAALLRLFEPGAADKAHAAARKLKSEVMKHNSRVAAEFLAGTARLIAQVEAEAAAAAKEAAQQQQQQQGGTAAATGAGGAIDPVQLERELYRIAAAERANPTGLI